jgi:hypothetical protein
VRLPAGTTITLPDGTILIVAEDSVIVAGTVAGTVAPCWVEASARRARVDGWRWPADVIEALEELAEVSGEIRRGQVPTPGADEFRPLTMDSVNTIDVTTYAQRRNLSTSYVRRLCRDGAIPGAVRDGWAWTIPAEAAS